MTSDPTASRRPLEGITVVDLTQILAGPYCTRLLADAGARVIKVEPPTGDPSRYLPPTISAQRSGYFANLNAGKLGVTADLRTPDGVDQVRQLAATADVLVENMRPGSLAAKGLGYEELSLLNPNLIMASISAFGATGTLAGRPGQGVIAEAYAGALDMTGPADGSPMVLGVSVADVSAGIHTYAAIVTALYRRDHAGGGGELIDVALFDAALPFQETGFLEAQLAGDDPTRNGTQHRSVVPYGVYDAGDGYLAIAAGTDRLWQRLEPLVRDPSGVQVPLATNDERVQHRDIVTRLIEDWARSVGGASAALAALQDAGIPAGPVRRVRDVAGSEPAISRGSFVRVPDPVRESMQIVNTPFRMSRSLIGPSTAAPRLGEHTKQIFHD